MNINRSPIRNGGKRSNPYNQSNIDDNDLMKIYRTFGWDETW